MPFLFDFYCWTQTANYKLDKINLFPMHRLFDTLQTFFLSGVSSVQKSPLINLPFHRKDRNDSCVYEQFVIIKNKNNSIQFRYNYSTHTSEYFSAPCSIACSTENLSFMRNILSLPISVCTIITYGFWTHNQGECRGGEDIFRNRHRVLYWFHLNVYLYSQASTA